MLIPLKYLITKEGVNPEVIPENDSSSSITILKCNNCSNEFMVPNNEANKMVHYCEADSCKIAYDKQQMAAQLEEKKKNSPESDIVKMALGK